MATLTYINSAKQLSRNEVIVADDVLRKSCQETIPFPFSGDAHYTNDMMQICWADNDPNWEGYEVWSLGVMDWHRISKAFNHLPKEHKTCYGEPVVEIHNVSVRQLREWLAVNEPMFKSTRKVVYKH